MTKKLLLLFACILSLTMTGQINTLPSSQSFTDAFLGTVNGTGPTGNGTNLTTVTGQGFAFYTNYAGSEVKPASRIFRDATVYSTAPAAIGIIPTSDHTSMAKGLKLDVSLNLTNYSGVSVSFVAKSMSNGTGTYTALVFAQTSIDGGTTWSAATQIGTATSFPNSDSASFTNYSYTFPANTSGAASVLMRFTVYRGSGSNNTAKVVIDDLNFTGTYTGVTAPSVALSPSTLTNFSQLDGFPSATQTATVSGMYLTGNLNVAVTAPYQVSLSSTGTFGTSVSLTPSAGTVNATNIYVRLNNATGTTGAAPGTITASSAGATGATVALSGATVTSAATNPAPFDLSTGNYVFSQWDAASAAGTYPANMALWTHNVNDPAITDVFMDNYSCVYSTTSGTRLQGLGTDGLAMVNTGNSATAAACGGTAPVYGFNGAYVLAINTTGKENVLVDWTGRTKGTAYSQQYALRLQYRIGAGNVNLNWQDIPSGGNAYTQYVAGPAGTTDSASSFTTALPDDTDNQPLVQLRWVYYRIAGTANSRSTLALDDITVYPAPVVATPIVATSISSLSFYQVQGFTTASQQFTVSGTTLSGNVTLSTTAPYEMSLTANGTYATSLSITPASGTLTDTVIYVRMNSASAGSFPAVITVSSAGAPDKTVTLSGATEASTATNPAPFDMSTGNYSFTQWAATSGAGNYPANMAFWQHTTVDPQGTEYFMANYGCAYNLTSASRIDGQGGNGVSMINTSDSQDTGTCAGTAATGTTVAYGKNGAIVVAVNTTSKDNLKVNWTARTIVKNARKNAFRLQYRIGAGNVNTGWQDIADTANSLAYTQYVNGDAGTAQSFVTALPEALNNQPVVQLRWVYLTVLEDGVTGSRSEIGLDDISVYSATVAQPQLTVTASSLSFAQTVGAPSAAQTVTVSGAHLTADATLTTAAPFEIALSQTGTYSTTLTLPQTSGTVSSTDIYVRVNSAATGTFTNNLTVATTGTTPAAIALTANVTSNVVTITNPVPFDLSTGNYSFTQWPATSPAGTYPANMRFWTHAAVDPTLTTPFVEDYNCVYNAASRTRINGDAANGILMINTSSAQYVNICNGGTTNGTAVLTNGFSGAVVLALNTTGKQNVLVNWTGRTITIGDGTPVASKRKNAFRMQYRIGADDINSGWQDIPSGSLAYTEYVAGDTNGSNAAFATTLPADATNQPVVQVRWVYYLQSGTTGSRSQLALDEVTVSGQDIPCFYTTVWNGTSWSNGTPTATVKAQFEGDYTSAASIAACEVIVTNNAHVTFVTGTTLTATNKVTVTAGASLVFQNNAALLQNSALENSGNIVFHKNSNALYRLDYTLWASPVSGQTLSGFAPATSADRFYTYVSTPANANTTSGHYQAVSSTTAFANGAGYLIRMPNTGSAAYVAGTETLTVDGTFTGTPHNGDITVALNTTGDQYTALGNPYPSPIGVAEVFAAGNGVLDGASPLYFWRKRNNAGNLSYYSVTATSYVLNSQDGGTAITGFDGDPSTWTIAPGQGFFVKAGAGSSFTFINGMRKPATATQTFFRSAHSLSRLWINISDAGNNFSQASVAYADGATLGLDYSLDGAAFSITGTSIYTTAENKALAVQTRPAFQVQDVVPVGFTVPATGQYTITLDHFDGVFADGQNVYIKDKLLGLSHNLNESAYSFTAEAGNLETRFEVVYTTDSTDGSLGTQSPVLDAKQVMVYKQDKAININAGTATINSVTVFDIRGRKLFSQDNVNDTTLVINSLNASQEVLIVEVATDKGTVSKKIVY